MIGTPRETIKILSKAGIHLSKRLGQHFLIDGNILKKIVHSASLREGDVVLEIGPGIGSLTEVLLETGIKVIAVEYDKKFFLILKENFASYPNFHLIEGDAMRLKVSDLPLIPNKVVSNLPYNISAPLVIKLLDEFGSVGEMIIMVQKEMAARMTATAHSKDYGQLSLKIEYHCQAKLLFNVPRSVFLPPPKVDSAVVRLVRLDPSKLLTDDPKGLFELIGVVFGQRRKTLANTLLSFGRSKDDIARLLEKVGIDSKRRAETMSLSDFVELERAIAELVRGAK
ncbi:MAG: 16S rRNA (adenine(1518)-N(6)/adenine(1519)-N(6))-dimethyltransferase RsmA [Actinomycetota bacterium]|nr:16S rRNA (adenine(1518)-N(6)/adenine(1519)-N(6))-dimethyltransferase RsmA [Actinomycetota bacterium]